MSTQLAGELHVETRRSARALAVYALGPIVMLAGLVWAFVQPHRLTLLQPGEHGFWALVVEPPLLVIAVGAIFHVTVVPRLLRDLAESEQR